MVPSSSVKQGAGQGGWALACCLLAVGCGSGKATLYGKVTVAGQPLKGGSVTFLTLDGKGGAVQANISAEGTYSAENVPFGNLKVLVTYVDPPSMPARPNFKGKGRRGDAAAKEDAGEKFRTPYDNLKAATEGRGARKTTVPAKYGDPDTTDLRVTVTETKQPHDIDIP